MPYLLKNINAIFVCIYSARLVAIFGGYTTVFIHSNIKVLTIEVCNTHHIIWVGLSSAKISQKSIPALQRRCNSVRLHPYVRPQHK